MICCVLLFRSHWFSKSSQIQAHFLKQGADSTVNVHSCLKPCCWVSFSGGQAKLHSSAVTARGPIVGLCAYFDGKNWQLKPGKSQIHMYYSLKRIPTFLRSVKLTVKKNYFTTLLFFFSEWFRQYFVFAVSTSGFWSQLCLSRLFVENIFILFKHTQVGIHQILQNWSCVTLCIIVKPC